MKFLPQELVRPHMIPINITYHNPMGWSNAANNEPEPDVLTIIYKDQDTGHKFVYEIQEPEIEIYIVKPEYRTFNHMRDMVEIEICDRYKVKYKNRWIAAAKKLGLENYARNNNISLTDAAKTSPYIFNADIQIETFYLIQFVLEYSSNMVKTLSIGKFDIENDIIQAEGFAPPGETPINAITYINMDTNDVYTLVLLKDNLPVYPIGSPKYEEIKHLRDNFYRQADEIYNNQQYMIDQCHEKFDEMYPGMKYNILYYDNEEKLIKDFMYIIHNTDNDFIGAWNIPYDMQNIIKRIEKIGLNPIDIIPDNRFGLKKVFFKEDTNPQAHKRKHQCVTSTVPMFVDDMVHYAGIRSGRGVLSSLKLNYIAQKELKDEKYDYSEISDIKHLFYDDLVKFILYNIKDVLLLVGLEKKTKDMSTIYSRMYKMFVFPNEAFTTTKVVWHSLIKFMYERGYVPGINRNKGKKHKSVIDYPSILGDKFKELGDISDEEFEELTFDILDDSDGDDDEEEKYQGAFVMNTLHMKPTSVEIMGKPSKFIHDNVADEDITSEYPTAINTCNISNETLVGKVMLVNDSAVDIPIPEGFVFRGDDKEKYKMDKGNFLLESYTEGDTFNFGNLFLSLPDPSEVLSDIEDIIKSKN